MIDLNETILDESIIPEKGWRRLFKAGILLKGINGIFQLISGTLILFVSKNYYTNLLAKLSGKELYEDPDDRFLSYLTRWLQHLSNNAKDFAGIYFLIHGVINIFLAVQLRRGRLWAYLLTIIVILLFISYQVFRITHTHSLLLTLITLWDAIFILVIWHEYKHQKAKEKTQH